MEKAKQINKMNLKECKSALRKFKRRHAEMEDELGYLEHGIYCLEGEISEAKERIKLLTPKKIKPC